MHKYFDSDDMRFFKILLGIAATVTTVRQKRL